MAMRKVGKKDKIGQSFKKMSAAYKDMQKKKKLAFPGKKKMKKRKS